MTTPRSSAPVQWLWRSVVYALASKRCIHGLMVGVVPLSSHSERDTAFAKTADALGLISEFAPVRMEEMRRNFARILIIGNGSSPACFRLDSRTAEISESYVLSGQTCAAELACTIVHEAQHARLQKLGLTYRRSDRARVERICVRAEYGFFLRLPEKERTAVATRKRLGFGGKSV